MRSSAAALALITLVLPAGRAVAFDDAFKTLGFQWDISAGPIPVSLEPSGSDDIDDGSDLVAVRAAFNAWACTEGTSIRFEETEEPGLAAFDNGDGVNSVFWDEDGSACGMGPGTLGIGGGDGETGDICFNGRDSTWGVGTATDVQSIAMHEIGHFIGFAHPCDNDADESSCIPSSRAIMFPAWSGENERDLRQSEIDGVRSVYPADPDLPSGCNGPFGPGEKCLCNDECVEGLVCIPDAQQVPRCGRTCAANAADCGTGAVCVLDVPQDGGVAPGSCVAITGQKPAGAICGQANECQSGTCLANIDLGTSICLAPCGNDDDCAGGTCFSDFCLGGFESIACEEPTIEDCQCSSTSVSTSSLSMAPGAFVVSALAFLLRRRRARA